MCFDTLGKDENFAFDLGMYFCQNDASAHQVLFNPNPIDLFV